MKIKRLTLPIIIMAIAVIASAIICFILGVDLSASEIMVAIGILVIIAYIIFVKKDKDVVYTVADKVGIILNFVDGLIILPLFSIVSWLGQAFPIGFDWIYQAFYFVPAIITLSLAASIAFRRKGFSRLGFFVQFIGPITFFILGILEYI